MASENETVEDIVKRVNRDCNSYPLPTAAAEMLKLVREMDAAHQREIAELKRQRKEALAIASDIDKCASIERHTDAMLKKNEVIVGLRKEVAELTAIINAECRKCGECEKFGKDCTAGDVDGAEDNRACEKFVSREVSELRECLKETMVDAVAEYKNNSCFRNVKCGEIERCDTCKVMKWRNALEGGAK